MGICYYCGRIELPIDDQGNVLRHLLANNEVECLAADTSVTDWAFRGEEVRAIAEKHRLSMSTVHIDP